MIGKHSQVVNQGGNYKHTHRCSLVTFLQVLKISKKYWRVKIFPSPLWKLRQIKENDVVTDFSKGNQELYGRT